METEISKLQQESGYPYVVNIDTANRANPVDGKIIMSNLCSEILQVQEPSLINDAQEFLQMGTDVSCNLGSTNVVNMMTSPDFGRSIRAMVRALTFVTDSSHIVAVPTIDHWNSQAHTFGLGAMGLHSYLAQQLIEYGSPESVEFTSIYFMLMNYWTLVESNNIARERGITFHNFEKSDYANGSYFDKYVTGEFVPKSDRVKELFKDVFIPSADWAELRDKVQADGLYHQNRLGCSAKWFYQLHQWCFCFYPPDYATYRRTSRKKIGKIYYPAAGLSTETIPYYTSAYDMDMRKVIDVYAAATEHVDQGLSLTLFMRSDIPKGLYEWKNWNKQTTRDLSILRNYAFNKGIKSIYYVRTFTDDGGEVGANQCESCVI